MNPMPFLSKTELSEVTEAATKEFLEQSGREKHIVAHQAVYESGSPAQSLFIVDQGLVALTLDSAKGAERILRIFGPGCFFGHRSYLAGEPYHATARALEATRLYQIPTQALETAMRRDPGIASAFMRTMARDLGRQEIRLQAQVDASAATRIAATLIYLNSLQIEHHFTRAQIAEYAGTTETTVIRVINDMAKNGILKTRGWKILIEHPDRLFAMARASE